MVTQPLGLSVFYPKFVWNQPSIVLHVIHRALCVCQSLHILKTINIFGYRYFFKLVLKSKCPADLGSYIKFCFTTSKERCQLIPFNRHFSDTFTFPLFKEQLQGRVRAKDGDVTRLCPLWCEMAVSLEPPSAERVRQHVGFKSPGFCLLPSCHAQALRNPHTTALTHLAIITHTLADTHNPRHAALPKPFSSGLTLKNVGILVSRYQCFFPPSLGLCRIHTFCWTHAPTLRQPCMWPLLHCALFSTVTRTLLAFHILSLVHFA